MELPRLLSISKLVYLPDTLCAFRDHAGPRLTDVQKVRRGLDHALHSYKRMAMAAAAWGRIDDPRLIAPLVQRITSVIIGGMQIGCPDLANEAIEACRKLPIKFDRRLRPGRLSNLKLSGRRIFKDLVRVGNTAAVSVGDHQTSRLIAAVGREPANFAQKRGCEFY